MKTLLLVLLLSVPAYAQEILVTPSDLSGVAYEILGPVESTGTVNYNPMTALLHSGHRSYGVVCTPDNIRKAALQRYGSRVYAVIGFISTPMPGGFRCSGTAVALAAPQGVESLPPEKLRE